MPRMSARQAVGVLGHHLHASFQYVFEDAHGPGGADTWLVPERTMIFAHAQLLIGPGLAD